MPNEKRQRQKAGREIRQQQIRAAQRKRRLRNRIIFLGVVAALVVLAAYLVSSGDDDGTDVATDGSTSTTEAAAGKTGSADCPKEDGSSERKTSFDGEPKMCIDEAKTYKATMKTSKGTIVMELDPKRAPKTVNNFVFLSRYKFYDGLTFHRVVPGFVIQGGDPQGNGSGGPGYKFNDELPKPEDYKAGSVAMANSGPNTNGSQFFILESDESGKNLVQAVGGEAKYSLFGQVTEGMDVVKAIIALGGGGDGPPSEKVTIESVTITES